jgi:hypothetical protein
MAYATCKCCGGGVFYGAGEEAVPPALCPMCEVRGQHCLHNVSEHGAAHSTRPHVPGMMPDAKPCGACAA